MPSLILIFTLSEKHQIVISQMQLAFMNNGNSFQCYNVVKVFFFLRLTGTQMKRSNKTPNRSEVEPQQEQNENEEENDVRITIRNRSSYSMILRRIIIFLFVLVVSLKVVGFLFDWDEEISAGLSPQVKQYRRLFLQYIGLK